MSRRMTKMYDDVYQWQREGNRQATIEKTKDEIKYLDSQLRERQSIHMERTTDLGGSASNGPLVALVTPLSPTTTERWIATASPSFSLPRARRDGNMIEKLGDMAADKRGLPDEANYDERSEASSSTDFDHFAPRWKEKLDLGPTESFREAVGSETPRRIPGTPEPTEPEDRLFLPSPLIIDNLR